MIELIVEEATFSMNKTLEALKNNLSKIRSGRAHPSMIQHIMVEYYGNLTPINQLANVSVEDARTLSINVWEKNMIAGVEKAILTSDLGITPATSGNVIRIPIPALTEDRRKEMIKVSRSEAEKCRVSIRMTRKNSNSDLKELNKQKEISDDELTEAEQTIQNLTDNYISKVDSALAEKEKTLLEF